MPVPTRPSSVWWKAGEYDWPERPFLAQAPADAAERAWARAGIRGRKLASGPDSERNPRESCLCGYRNARRLAERRLTRRCEPAKVDWSADGAGRVTESGNQGIVRLRLCDSENELFTASISVFAERCQRWRVLAGGKRPFKASNSRRMSPHTLGYLSLRKSSVMASLEQGVKEFTLFTLNALDLCANGRTTQKRLDNLVMSFHVSPPSSGSSQWPSQSVVSFEIS